MRCIVQRIICQIFVWVYVPDCMLCALLRLKCLQYSNADLQLQLADPFCTSSLWRWALSTQCTRLRCDSSCRCSICRWHNPPSRQSQRNVSRTSLSLLRSARTRTQHEASTRRTNFSSQSSWRWRFSYRRKSSGLKSFSASSKVQNSFSFLLRYREVVIATGPEAAVEWHFIRITLYSACYK